MGRIWLLIPCILATSTLSAQEPASPPLAWYDIELIVFENTDPGAGLSETWPDDPGLPALDGAKELIPPGADPVVVSELDVTGSLEPALHALEADETNTEISASDVNSNEFNDVAANPLDGTVPGSSSVAPMDIEVWVPFMLRAKGDYQLRDVARRLDRSGRYRVISHSAWRQRLQRGDPGTPIHLHSETGNLETYHRLTRGAMTEGQNRISRPDVASFQLERGDPQFSTSPEFSDLGTGAVIEPMSHRQLEFPLDGTVTIRLSRYLHIDADLVWQRLEKVRRDTPPLNATESSETNESIEITVNGETLTDPLLEQSMTNTETMTRLNAYRLRDSRRMRSKELHYIDHPIFGILALITPVESGKNDEPAGR